MSLLKRKREGIYTKKKVLKFVTQYFLLTGNGNFQPLNSPDHITGCTLVCVYDTTVVVS